MLTTTVSGQEVLNAGINQVNNFRVISTGQYKKTSQLEVPINHNRRMKVVYNKYGKGGVNTYINLIQEFAEKQKEAQQMQIIKELDSPQDADY